jgi:hypothetical protein
MEMVVLATIMTAFAGVADRCSAADLRLDARYGA